MGYRDQKVIRDTRDAKAAEFIGKTGTAFRAGIAQSQRRQEEKKKELEQEEKEQKDLQRKAQAATQGRYDEIAKYKRTGNKSLDDQIIEEIEKAARAESEAYMKAFGNDGDEKLIAEYQKLKAGNSRDLNDLTMFVGSFDKDVDEAAAAIANGSVQMPGGGDFDFDLYVQNNGDVELKKGADGRYSIFGSGSFAGREIPLGKYYDDFQNKGTRYEMVDDDYGLVMDEWSKSIIENGDNLYKQSQQTGGSTKVSTGKKDGGKGTSTPGVKGNVYNVDGYKNDIIRKLKANQGKEGISASIKGGPSLSNEQIYMNLRENLSIPGYAGSMNDVSYDEFISFGGNLDDIYSAFADQVVDLGTYKRGGITNVVATNITDPNAGIKNVTLNQ